MHSHEDEHGHHGHQEPRDHGDLSRIHERDYWEERYASREPVWSGRPNEVVVETVAPLTPGHALDVAAGEGGDAVWLAEQGWQVTALDISSAGLDRGRAAAAERGLSDRIDWVRADARTWATDQRFDLVTSAFLHLPPGVREPWLASVAALVEVGGRLLVVGHAASDVQVVARPDVPELFVEAAELALQLDPAEWDVLTASSRPRLVPGPDGELVTVHDEVLHARRRAAA
jgi:SAM-dependent methyltransferase